MECLERKHVHAVYDQMAHFCFAYRHHKRWKGVKLFLKNLPPGSIVADIGCGQGRYCGVNKNLYFLACDPCMPLLNCAQILKQTDRDDFVRDKCPNLSIRSSVCDAVLCIGVLHHISSKSRRIKFLQELARLLSIGGKAIIYVWAMEHTKRQFPAQDLLVPWDSEDSSSVSMDNSVGQCKASQLSKIEASKSLMDKFQDWFHHQMHLFKTKPPAPVVSTTEPMIEFSNSQQNLPQSTTTATVVNEKFPEFKIREFPQSSCPYVEEQRIEQDDSPPSNQYDVNNSLNFQCEDEVGVSQLDNTTGGHMSESICTLPYYRYYHVFRENELESLINQYVPQFTIESAEMDHSNWMVICKKLES